METKKKINELQISITILNDSTHKYTISDIFYILWSISGKPKTKYNWSAWTVHNVLMSTEQDIERDKLNSFMTGFKLYVIILY